MASYAIGDLQGCFASLQALLKKIGFDRNKDHLYFVGDIVNRGTGSLACLRFVRDLGRHADMVLGNHDLHLLAVAEGVAKRGKLDTLDEVLNAPDAADLLAWLRSRPMLMVEPSFAIVHAGLLPQWDWPQAQAAAHEVEAYLRGPDYRDLLVHMYGNEPTAWREDLQGYERLRIIINAMTRMRTLDKAGHMDLGYKGEMGDLPKGAKPWFEAASKRGDDRFAVAGHWSALGLYISPKFIGLDSGCVWGRELTALRIEDRKVFQVPCVAGDLRESAD